MGKENRQQQNSDATSPEEKMLGQLWGIDLFLVHNRSILQSGDEAAKNPASCSTFIAPARCKS
jgi:hypothetical protein